MVEVLEYLVFFLKSFVKQALAKLQKCSNLFMTIREVIEVNLRERSFNK